MTRGARALFSNDLFPYVYRVASGTALAMLARANTDNQDAIVLFGGIPPLLRIIAEASSYDEAVQVSDMVRALKRL